MLLNEILLFPAILFCFSLSGCSTQFKSDEETNRLNFNIQHANTIPIKDSVEPLAVSDMLPGDILLSSATGLNSWEFGYLVLVG